MTSEIKEKLRRIQEISSALVEEDIDESEGIAEMLKLMEELISMGYVPPEMGGEEN